MHILVVVDVQNDFVTGSLGTAEAQAAIPKIESMVENDWYDDVFYTFDTHYGNYSDTMEGKYLPVEHCKKGTAGWASALSNFNLTEIEYDETVVEKETFGSLYLPECIKRYAETYYDKGINDINSITIIGLCTDICIIANAVILKTSFPKSSIICDASACAGVTPEKHKAALEVMRSLQIEVVNND